MLIRKDPFDIRKSQPTAGDVHVSVPLTNLVIGYTMDRTADHFSNQLCPVVPVDHQNGAFYVFPRGNWYRISAAERPPATQSAGGGFPIVTQTYYAKPFAIHTDVSDQIRANQDAAIQLDETAAKWVTQQMWLKKDYDWCTKFFTAGSTPWSRVVDVTNTGAGYGGLWSAGGSTPIKDILGEIELMRVTTTKRPTILALGAKVWTKLQSNADFLSRIALGNNSAPSIVTKELLAAILGIQQVVIVDGMYNNADEGQADNFVYLGGNNALLLYNDPNPGLWEAAACKCFTWTGMYGASADAEGIRVKNFRMEPIASDRIEAEAGYDMNVTASDLGVFFGNTIA